MATKLVAFVSIPHLPAHVASLSRPHYPTLVSTTRSDRAIVLDVNEAGRAAGICSGKPVFEARRRCPRVRITTVDRTALAAISAQIAQSIAVYGDDVRRVGGGWTCTIVGLGADYEDTQTIATQIARAVDAVGVRCGIGFASGPHLARIAAHQAGEGGIRCIVPGAEAAFLAPLSIERLPGLSARVCDHLTRLGVQTIEQLRLIPLAVLRSLCGPRADSVVRLAHGIDGQGNAERSSLEATWEGPPCADHVWLRARLHELTASVGQTLRVQKQATGQLTVTVAWVDGMRRQHIERDPMRHDLDSALHAWSRTALGALLAERRLGVRSITVAITDIGPRQVDLFADDDARPRRLQQALDMLAGRYGQQVILPGAYVGCTGGV